MNTQNLKKLLSPFLVFFTLFLISTNIANAEVEDEHGHGHTETVEMHSDEGDHEDHATDGHEDEDHEDHEDHEGEGHIDSRHEEGGHSEEEAGTKISTESAKRMGLKIEISGPKTINQTIPLTGRITLNQNAKADIRARFDGIVRAVKTELGQEVQKGQVLAVVEANDSLRDYNIIAPMNGVVLSRNTNVGDVTGAETLFTIADLSNVWAKFHIFPRDAEFVRSNQNVKIHTLEREKMANGKIDMLFPTADELSQTQIAIIELPNTARIWKPGMTVEGDVVISGQNVRIAVKNSALQKMEEQGDVVFVQSGNSYEARPVVIGQADSEYTEILQGLDANEKYVAEGSYIVKSDILKSTAAHAH